MGVGSQKKEIRYLLSFFDPGTQLHDQATREGTGV